MSTRATRLERFWRRLAPLPGGRCLFGRILGLIVPYSGSIRPRVQALEPGRAVVALRDRRRLRNHVGSVHALALANLGELASGLAMTLALPPTARGIPIRIEVDYLKKARGTIIAHGRAAPPAEISVERDDTATAELVDDAGAVVARLVVTWRLAPRERELGTAPSVADPPPVDDPSGRTAHLDPAQPLRES